MGKKYKNIQSEFKFLMSGVADIISEKELISKLKKSQRKRKPLRIKLGVDASASDIHLGTAVPLFKLKQFQDLGHQVIFLIGDFTGMIGDPSGQLKTRKSLTEEEVKENAKNLKKQIFKILDPKKTEIVFNSSWCKDITFADVIKLASHYTVAQLLERDDFETRYKKEQPIGLHEFLYPLIQGYDSVILKADIEICGTDQRFNCLVARTLQEVYHQEPEVIIMMPLLEGMGTKEKMSKSLGNYIGITDTPEEMFGGLMRITDEQVSDYFKLCTQLTGEEIKKIKDKLKDKPKETKERLAFEIVKFYHGKDAAEKAKEIFELKHGKRLRGSKDLSASVAVIHELKNIAKGKQIFKKDLKGNKIWICRLLTLTKATGSNSEARRLIQQKSVKIDGVIVNNTDMELALKKDGYLLQVGKRKIFHITFK